MATPILLRLYHVVSENLASQSGIKPMPIQNPYKFLQWKAKANVLTIG